MCFFLVFTPHQQVWMTNIQNTKHKTPNTGRSIVMSWLANLWLTTLALIKHFVVKRGPLSLGIRSHTCHLRASKSDSGKQQSSHGLWPYELILRQMHSKGTNLKLLLLDQNIMLIFFFFKHLPYLEDNDKLSKAFNLTKGAILKSYYHDTLVPITHQNKNKQVNKSFK